MYVFKKYIYDHLIPKLTVRGGSLNISTLLYIGIFFSGVQISVRFDSQI